jgi:hypothetical protein
LLFCWTRQPRRDGFLPAACAVRAFPVAALIHITVCWPWRQHTQAVHGSWAPSRPHRLLVGVTSCQSAFLSGRLGSFSRQPATGQVAAAAAVTAARGGRVAGRVARRSFWQADVGSEKTAVRWISIVHGAP